MNGKRLEIKTFFAMSLLTHAFLAVAVLVMTVNGSRHIQQKDMLFVDLNQLTLPETVQRHPRTVASSLPEKTPVQTVKEAAPTQPQPMTTAQSQPAPQTVVAKKEIPIQPEGAMALKSVAASAPVRQATPSANQSAATATEGRQATPAVISTLSGSSGGEVQFGSATGPAFQDRVLPVYPLIARKFGKEGKVVLRLSIDEKGNMTGVETLTDPGYGFANAAIDALRKSSFAPARVAGRAVAVKAILPIRFSLQGVN